MMDNSFWQLRLAANKRAGDPPGVHQSVGKYEQDDKRTPKNNKQKKLYPKNGLFWLFHVV